MARIEPAGWIGSISDFLSTDEVTWLSSLEKHHIRCMLEPADESQRAAWHDEYEVISSTLTRLTSDATYYHELGIIFEYELPRERGRRPDIVILSTQLAIVLEFKGHSSPAQSHVDQVAAYARDLQHYHEASHDLNVIPILVLTRAKKVDCIIDGVRVVDPQALDATLGKLLSAQESGCAPNILDWLKADYAPLPSLVTAAMTIFENEELPAGDVPECL